MKEITKIGLALIKDGALLVVRKENTSLSLIPGGRPEGTESDSEALVREIREELACDLRPDDLEFIGAFSDLAANEPDTIVTVRLYRGTLDGNLKPSREIGEYKWFNPNIDNRDILAPSISNKILPALLELRYL